MTSPQAAGSAVSKGAQLPGVLGKVARGAQAVGKVPQTILGGAAKGVGTVVKFGLHGVAKGAVWAARGFAKIANKLMRGTWSVTRKTG